MGTCRNCGNCCNHVAIRLDKPKSKSDYQDILWFLLHDNVKVFIDKEDNDWYVEFATPCSWRKGNACANHKERPGICRDYSPKDCVSSGCGNGEKISFSTYDEFTEYLRKNRIDYQFKWQKI